MRQRLRSTQYSCLFREGGVSLFESSSRLFWPPVVVRWQCYCLLFSSPVSTCHQYPPCHFFPRALRTHMLTVSQPWLSCFPPECQRLFSASLSLEDKSQHDIGGRYEASGRGAGSHFLVSAVTTIFLPLSCFPCLCCCFYNVHVGSVWLKLQHSGCTQNPFADLGKTLCCIACYDVSVVFIKGLRRKWTSGMYDVRIQQRVCIDIAGLREWLPEPTCGRRDVSHEPCLHFFVHLGPGSLLWVVHGSLGLPVGFVWGSEMFEVKMDESKEHMTRMVGPTCRASFSSSHHSAEISLGTEPCLLARECMRPFV